uniref:Uncharacterized protein n=1 Tax=Candidatus Kentrum sp. UNK TaxID=2126344 RepID=A0A451A1G1_9GAMM|nr:MAG: hypothetical protein BECKUNK1418G_GA0071005_100932 [Candidatus Kentron sp. UNK]VFK70147.1 MAG: hypothetical protein BECKUNK1418H_GA0071006_102432 [Candidatus Kentron sp. UNK]
MIARLRRVPAAYGYPSEPILLHESYRFWRLPRSAWERILTHIPVWVPTYRDCESLFIR